MEVVGEGGDLCGGEAVGFDGIGEAGFEGGG